MFFMHFMVRSLCRCSSLRTPRLCARNAVAVSLTTSSRGLPFVSFMHFMVKGFCPCSSLVDPRTNHSSPDDSEISKSSARVNSISVL